MSSFVMPMLTGQSLYYHPGGALKLFTQPDNGDMGLIPMWFPDGVTLDRIGMRVTSAGSGGSVTRLGIYEDSGGCFPGDLLFDAGTVSSSSTGAKEITISEAITTLGLYWLACVTQGTPGTTPIYRAMFAVSQNLPVVWCGTSPPSDQQNGYMYQSVTGTLPGSLTPGSLIGAAPSGFQDLPQVFVRVA